ncbi:mechanosensitive ion channel family protein [Novosphingobium album (ex Hu et al. 2023)]|uniref:Mechanosensitive ion channel family protein n=1 Tax=Novosphingobium album (ex Hu et al. 2023) TaxID=2930093 RepID=A0ABT0B301_9SPHN|nr:mechanosensitive ion channel domain-containing protein [Novosphingobium album (ex Hu et al. 2023)]MCJ2179274.1 mechanosensitive ion channel family protein [Novosphingobium album (ex Hu et al. 2023)]
MADWIEQFTGRLPAWGEQLMIAALAAVIGIAVALIAHRVLFRILRKVVSGSQSETDDILVRRLARPARYAFVALGVAYAARETAVLDVAWQKVSGFVMPFLLGWIVLALMRSFVEAMMVRTDITVADNRNARRRRTRLAILSRIGTFVIVFITVALMLFAIPGVRQIGITLMASAGLAALAVGAAAQPALKALIGGFQMAMTEPIAIDDVVIIDGEWGRIEDIRTTYVIVKIWDERRLIVPSNKFLENTFQNWTKQSAQLTGTVMLYLDHAADVTPVRAEFERQVTADPRWDKRAQGVQVTDMSDDSIEVRLLMTARNSGDLFDLRCAMREGMLAWVRREMPEALRRNRTLPTAPVELAASPSMADAIAVAGEGKHTGSG